MKSTRLQSEIKAVEAATPLDAIIDRVAERVIARLLPHLALGGDELITIVNCEEKTGLKPRAFSDAGRAGKFPAAKAGHKLVAKRGDVEAWIASRRVVPKPIIVDGGDSVEAQYLSLVAGDK